MDSLDDRYDGWSISGRSFESRAEDYERLKNHDYSVSGRSDNDIYESYYDDDKRKDDPDSDGSSPDHSRRPSNASRASTVKDDENSNDVDSDVEMDGDVDVGVNPDKTASLKCTLKAKNDPAKVGYALTSGKSRDELAKEGITFNEDGQWKQIERIRELLGVSDGEAVEIDPEGCKCIEAEDAKLESFSAKGSRMKSKMDCVLVIALAGGTKISLRHTNYCTLPVPESSYEMELSKITDLGEKLEFESRKDEYIQRQKTYIEKFVIPVHRLTVVERLIGEGLNDGEDRPAQMGKNNSIVTGTLKQVSEDRIKELVQMIDRQKPEDIEDIDEFYRSKLDEVIHIEYDFGAYHKTMLGTAKKVDETAKPIFNGLKKTPVTKRGGFGTNDDDALRNARSRLKRANTNESKQNQNPFIAMLLKARNKLNKTGFLSKNKADQQDGSGSKSDGDARTSGNGKAPDAPRMPVLNPDFANDGDARTSGSGQAPDAPPIAPRPVLNPDFANDGANDDSVKRPSGSDEDDSRLSLTQLAKNNVTIAAERVMGDDYQSELENDMVKVYKKLEELRDLDEKHPTLKDAPLALRMTLADAKKDDLRFGSSSNLLNQVELLKKDKQHTSRLKAITSREVEAAELIHDRDEKARVLEQWKQKLIAKKRKIHEISRGYPADLPKRFVDNFKQMEKLIELLEKYKRDGYLGDKPKPSVRASVISFRDSAIGAAKGVTSIAKSVLGALGRMSGLVPAAAPATAVAVPAASEADVDATPVAAVVVPVAPAVDADDPAAPPIPAKNPGLPQFIRVSTPNADADAIVPAAPEDDADANPAASDSAPPIPAKNPGRPQFVSVSTPEADADAIVPAAPEDDDDDASPAARRSAPPIPAKTKISMPPQPALTEEEKQELRIELPREDQIELRKGIIAIEKTKVYLERLLKVHENKNKEFLKLSLGDAVDALEEAITLAKTDADYDKLSRFRMHNFVSKTREIGDLKRKETKTANEKQTLKAMERELIEDKVLFGQILLAKGMTVARLTVLDKSIKFLEILKRKL